MSSFWLREKNREWEVVFLLQVYFNNEKVHCQINWFIVKMRWSPTARWEFRIQNRSQYSFNSCFAERNNCLYGFAINYYIYYYFIYFESKIFFSSLSLYTKSRNSVHILSSTTCLPVVRPSTLWGLCTL